MFVPQLSSTWYDATKIVGISDDEFISDFLLIQDKSSRWHCIGIGGQEHIQDSFFHAVGTDLLEPFSYTDRVYSNGDKNLDETDWMWAPYAIYTKEQDNAYLYYHHQTKSHESQMRILQSTDDKLDRWVPLQHSDLAEGCIAFAEGGCRDACIFYDEEAGKYLMYYAGAGGIALRASDDLIHWSDATTVMSVPEGYQAAESPFVIKKHGYYYLFVSGFDYGRMAVYASKDYADFGDPKKDLLGELNGHAPEIVTVNGTDYIACAAINATDGSQPYAGGKPAEHNIVGVYIQELKWVKQDSAVWMNVVKAPEPTQPPLPTVTAQADYHWTFDGTLQEEKTGTTSVQEIPASAFLDGGNAFLGKALWFGGTEKYDMAPFDFQLGQTFTISFYMAMDAANNDFNVLFFKGPKTAGHLELYVQPNGCISFYQNELGVHDTETNVCDGNWHHVVFTYDGFTLNGYVDGTRIYTAEISAVIVNNEEPLQFGCFVHGEEEIFYYNGGIDELKIFHRTLAEEEFGVN